MVSIQGRESRLRKTGNGKEIGEGGKEGRKVGLKGHVRQGAKRKRQHKGIRDKKETQANQHISMP